MILNNIDASVTVTETVTNAGSTPLIPQSASAATPKGLIISHLRMIGSSGQSLALVIGEDTVAVTSGATYEVELTDVIVQNQIVTAEGTGTGIGYVVLTYEQR